MKGQLLEHSQKPSIALVDDDPIVTEAYASILSQYYQVITFNNPEEFLKYLDYHEVSPFEVLITDLRMPMKCWHRLRSR
jgi:DNA-binding NtrC family response regulator